MSLGMLVKPFFKSSVQATKELADDGKRPENVLVYIVPSLLDVVGTIFDTAGIFYTNVSVSQMLKGFVVVFTYFISLVGFRQRMRATQHIGILLIFLSEVVIGYSNIDTLEAKCTLSGGIGSLLEADVGKRAHHPLSVYILSNVCIRGTAAKALPYRGDQRGGLGGSLGLAWQCDIPVRLFVLQLPAHELQLLGDLPAGLR
jgi:uncharacterized membrane protein